MYFGSWEKTLVKSTILLLLACVSAEVFANSSGVINRSRGTSTCNQCHGGASLNTNLTLTTPDEVAPGSVNSFSLELSHDGAGSGFNMSATGGTLAAGANSKLVAGQLTHTGVIPVSGGRTVWNMQWTAPAEESEQQIFVCANAVNGDGNTTGDETFAVCRFKTIIVGSSNAAPVANAGSDQSIFLGETVQLNGGDSSDPEGDSISYQWSIDSAPQGSLASLSNSQVSDPSFTPDIVGTYSVSLVVSDAGSSSTADSVTITVNEIEEPADPFNGLPVADSNPLPGIEVPDAISNNESISVVNDFNGDLSGDMLFRDTETNQWTIYQLANGEVSESFVKDGMSARTSWQFSGSGDFNGDGRTDVLIRNAVSGQWYIYNLNGNSFVSRGYAAIPDAETVEVQAVADFNNDSYADVLVRSEVTGEWIMTLLNNLTVVDELSPPMSKVLSWNIVAAKDYDGNGSSDILIRNASSGSWYIYLYEDTDIISRGYITSLTEDLTDEIQTTGDFNGDGKVDVLLRNTETRQWSIIYMNGRTPHGTGGIPLTTSTVWDFLTANDFNGDGIADIAIRNSNTEELYIYLMGTNGEVSSEDFSNASLAATLTSQE